jgi:long-chain fatty acid transport protein
MGMQLELSEPWLLNFGVGYDSSFQDSSSISPMLPAGTAWRFGLGARHRGSKSMSWGVAAEYVYGGNLHVEKQSPLPVALGGRGDLAGSYNDTAMIFLAGNLNWKF